MNNDVDETRAAVYGEVQRLLLDEWVLDVRDLNQVSLSKEGEIRYFDFRRENGSGPDGSLTKEEYDRLGGVKPAPTSAAGSSVVPPPPPILSAARGVRRPPPPPPLPGALPSVIPPTSPGVPQPDLKTAADRERKVKDDEQPLKTLPKNEFVERLELVMKTNPALTLRELQEMIEAGRSVLFSGSSEAAQDTERSRVRFGWLNYGDRIEHIIQQGELLAKTEQSELILGMLKELSDMQKTQPLTALSAPSSWQANVLEGLAAWIQTEKERQDLQQENERLLREAGEAAEAEARRLAAEAEAKRQADAQDAIRRAHRAAVDRNRRR